MDGVHVDSEFRTIDVRPTSGALGAEIRGVDLSHGLDDERFAEIRRAFALFGVIFFRDQDLTPEQHIAFAERWGTINVNRFFQPVDGYPMIAEVRKEAHDTGNIGGSWHADHSYDRIPAMGSVLYAREVPAFGGDTLFASMYHAYETLSDGMKRVLDGLRAEHSSRHVFGEGERVATDSYKGRIGNPELATQDASHPVVIRHPESGRRALYVNPRFTLKIAGWAAEESRSLLEFLYRHATRPEFTTRFRWRRGSMAFWDNRATWHYAVNDYQGARRVMHRITLDGSVLG